MTVLDYLKDHYLLLDGGFGTLLQSAGLPAGELPERWNVTHPDDVTAIHKAYFEAGSNIVNTNTFGANPLKFPDGELERVISAAVANADRARKESRGDHPKFIALDIGPLGKLLRPYGELDFEDAVAAFAKVVRAGASGADLVMIETMSDSYETKAALLAVRENCDLPVFVSNAYGEDGKLLTGASPEAMCAMLEGLGADVIGANCSLGPRQLVPVAERYLAASSLPVMMKPNAGMPQVRDGKTVYDIDADAFAEAVKPMIDGGVRVLGGCCGTTPDHIRALARLVAGKTPQPITNKNETVVSSSTHALAFGERPILIGERINPTGKKRFRQALQENDMGYILNEGLRQTDAGVDALDVNVGTPGVDEAALLVSAVTELQAVTDLPLQIDTASPVAMERALRRYNGKALINSVNGKEESLCAVLPLVKKYGGVVVALTLDESGIPDTIEGRVVIARHILDVAAQYGIEKKNIVFDTLAMTVSADRNAANVTLGALSVIRHELGCHTLLGVSNVSFGLPDRDAVNRTFFALAMEHGLSGAIMNPDSKEMLKAYYAYCALHGMDPDCADYIRVASESPAPSAAPAQPAGDATLRELIEKGLRDAAKTRTEELLSSREALDVVNWEIIPALDAVGKGFEEKRVYLPGLLMSAEAAKASFEAIKAKMSGAPSGKSRGCFVLATVKGDIHDIGKNIVRLLLENYGFEVADLGRDVPPERVVAEVKARKAPFAGLSALMTTTVPAMEETVSLLHKEAPWCKVVVGGAVLTADYAASIGADHYAPDAMDTVRYALSFDN